MFTAVNDFLDDMRGGRMIDAPVVHVEQGDLLGKIVPGATGKCFYSFQGIPYAKPPLGSLRFKAPQPPEAWEGIRDATSEGNVSAQVDWLGHKEFAGDENCLFLNVYTTNLDGEFLPVMVYIHGGGFRYGSGNSNFYGADYLVDKDVVVVTLNYRCGPLGFLSLNTPEVPGNAGLKDIIQALNWVKQNIGSFGGNSGNITVFGESCGGVAVSILTASPLSKNMISKAIIQSGTALNSWAFQKNPIENAKLLARTLGSEVEDVDELLEFLSATPVKDMIKANEKLHPEELFMEKGANLFGPVVEKEFPGVDAVLTEPFIDILTSGRVANVPVMIGTTSLEFTFERINDDLQIFIPDNFNIDKNTDEAIAIAKKIRELYFKGGTASIDTLAEYYTLLSDKLVNVDTHRYVQYLVKASSKPIYYYKFDYVGGLNIYKNFLESFGLKHAGHMDELGYLFRMDLLKDVQPSPHDEKMRERMLRLWTNFAKCGNPTPEESSYITVTWLPVTKDNLYYMNLGDELSLDTNPSKERMDFWDELYAKYYKIWEHSKTNDDAPHTENTVVSEVSEEVDCKVTTNTIESVTYSEVVETKDESKEIITETVIQDPIIIESTIEKMPEDPIVVESVVEKTHEQPIPELNEERDKADKVVTEDKTDKVVAEDKTDKVVAEDKTDKVVEDKTDRQDKVEEAVKAHNGDTFQNGNGVEDKFAGSVRKSRPSNEIKMVQPSNGAPRDVIRANDPPEDDLPKNIGVNKFVNFFESLGGKK